MVNERKEECQPCGERENEEEHHTTIQTQHDERFVRDECRWTNNEDNTTKGSFVPDEYLIVRRRHTHTHKENRKQRNAAGLSFIHAGFVDRGARTFDREFTKLPRRTLCEAIECRLWVSFGDNSIHPSTRPSLAIYYRLLLFPSFLLCCLFVVVLLSLVSRNTTTSRSFVERL